MELRFCSVDLPLLSRTKKARRQPELLTRLSRTPVMFPSLTVFQPVPAYSWLHTCSFHPGLKRILLAPSPASTPTSLSFHNEAWVYMLATPPHSCVTNSSGK